MIESLSDRIYSNKRFQNEYHELIKYGLQKKLRISNGVEDDIVIDAAPRLLQSASTFAASTSVPYRKAAYRIAVNSWSLLHDTYQNVVEPARFILQRLGNFPAVVLLDSKSRYPKSDEKYLSSWMETEYKRLENTVFLGNEEYVLTNFQKKIWDILNDGRSLTISAPTSAGKSFTLQKYILSRYAVESRYSAAYLVPTRALISQVSYEFKVEILEQNLEGIAVTSIPIPFSEIEEERVLYVLTQERLQVLLDRDESVNFDLIVADEAQSIQDDGRGVIFQNVIEEALQRRGDTQIMFAAPLAQNPEIFRTIFERSDLPALNVDETPVAQNLVFVDRIPHTQRFQVQAQTDSVKFDLGEKRVPRSFSSNPKTLANLAYEFGDSDINLIYEGKPSTCENIAGYVADLLSQPEVSDPVEEFADFVEEHIHPTFPLSHVLRRGVAFHYGNMPSLVRQGVEELFTLGKIQYLVTTSTLLQGVNLPARNLFLRRPVTGRSDPLSSIDFWNLAGRAGRLRKDFEGNVFILDLSKWEENPMDGPKKQELKSSFSNYIQEEDSGFVSFAEDSEHVSGDSQGLENTFTKLYIALENGELDSVFDRINVKQSRKARIYDALNAASNAIDLSIEVIKENQNVSPYRQNDLYIALSEKAAFGNIRLTIPPRPMQVNAYERISAIFQLTHKYLEKRRDASHKRSALIALKWMRGDQYFNIIDGEIKYQRSQNSNAKNRTLIYDMLRFINNDIRFKYVKHTRCYISILEKVLSEQGYDDKVKSIPSLPIFLELGASSETMIALMSLGISRMTASILKDQIPVSDYDRSQALSWLRRHDFSYFDLPPVCLKELEAAIA